MRMTQNLWIDPIKKRIHNTDSDWMLHLLTAQQPATQITVVPKVTGLRAVRVNDLVGD